MRFLKDFLADVTVQKIIRWVFLFLLGGALFLAIYFTSDQTLRKACDSCFVPGCVLVALGFFSLVNRYGGFDFFLYGANAALNAIRKGSPKEYEDLMDYKEKKQVSREMDGPVYLPYFIYGVLWLIASGIILGIYKASL
jgi:hypothetical protein